MNFQVTITILSGLALALGATPANEPFPLETLFIPHMVTELVDTFKAHAVLLQETNQHGEKNNRRLKPQTRQLKNVVISDVQRIMTILEYMKSSISQMVSLLHRTVKFVGSNENYALINQLNTITSAEIKTMFKIMNALNTAKLSETVCFVYESGICSKLHEPIGNPTNSNEDSLVQGEFKVRIALYDNYPGWFSSTADTVTLSDGTVLTYYKIDECYNELFEEYETITAALGITPSGCQTDTGIFPSM